MPPVKQPMDWTEVHRRFTALGVDEATNTVYGVPAGGKPVANLCRRARVTDDIRQANVIIDDIIDTGHTVEAILGMDEVPEGVRFVALIDKQNNEVDRTLGWIVFPWESMNDPAQVSGLNVCERIRAEYQGSTQQGHHDEKGTTDGNQEAEG